MPQPGFPCVLENLENLENIKFIFQVLEMSWNFTMSENILEMSWKKYFLSKKVHFKAHEYKLLLNNKTLIVVRKRVVGPINVMISHVC